MIAPLPCAVLKMSPQISLRIPAWLAGSTIALTIAAAARVAEVKGIAGILELAQQLTLVAMCVAGLVVVERYETNLADVYWPSPAFRRLVFLAVFIALDCYLASIFFLRAAS